jgi:hypothetical protein
VNKSEWLDLVSACSCVVCGQRPIEIHHIEDVRDENSDYATAALCMTCHRSEIGVHGMSRRGFERRTKLSQLDLLKLTIKAIAKNL